MTAEPPAGKTTLDAFDIACVVIGGIIGIGIFFTPQKVAAAVDSPGQVIAAWAIGGVMILFGALVYARLSQVAPGYGGVFEYLRKAFGAAPAFLYGWCNLLIIQSGALAVVGLVMAENLQKALACAPFGDAGKALISTTAIGGLALVNAVGLRMGRNVQVTLTVIKTTAVFAIVVIALFASGPGAEADVVDREPVGFFRALAAAIFPVLFACGGWQHGSFVATVARRPLRDVPVGIVGGVVVVVIAYLTVNLAYLDLLGMKAAAASETIAVDAVAAAVGEGGGEGAAVVSRVFAAVIVVSALGVMNTISMAPPYVLHAMGQQGLFFAPVGRLHAGFGTPVLAILLQGGWAIGLLWATQVLAWSAAGAGLDPLGFLLDGLVFVDWLFYGACGVALCVVLARRPLERGDRLYFAVACLFALSALAVTGGALVGEWLDSSRPYKPSVTGLVVLGLGGAAYLGFRRRGVKSGGGTRNRARIPSDGGGHD